MNWLEQITFNNDGLVPAIAQDQQTGRILMMAWMNAESLQLTMQTKQAVYYSRSRQKLWHKGETSGHVQQVHNIRLDCDTDVLVLSVTQIGGIACHTGRESCFYLDLDMTSDQPKWQAVDPIIKDPNEIYGDKQSINKENYHQQTHQQIEKQDVLTNLDNILQQRKQADADSSYVASLYHKGLNKILEKVGEEATESIISAKDYHTGKQLANDQPTLSDLEHDLIYEIADLWFHTLVTLAWFDLDSKRVLAELARRFGMSGIEEKANRPMNNK